MELELFWKTYPRLYHMAHKDALPSILEHGLRSTSSLLDLYDVRGSVRSVIETKMRPESVVIRHSRYGVAVVRDQKPIGSDRRLESSLAGVKAEEFHKLLNSMVFFWVNPERLRGLRNAKAYRGDPQLVLTLDTRLLMDAYWEKILLCPMNSGACRPIAHPRSIEMFQRIKDYDFDYWRKKKGSANKAVVECTVQGRIETPGRYIIETEIVTPR